MSRSTIIAMLNVVSYLVLVGLSKKAGWLQSTRSMVSAACRGKDVGGCSRERSSTDEKKELYTTV